MRAVIYARVSTADQHCGLQLTELREYATRMKWEIAGEYVEKAGGACGVKRPEQNKLLRDARLRMFDVVLCWKIDRFGRSTGDFINNILALDAAGVRFIAPNQNIDTDQRNPFQKAMMHLMAVFAELEKDLIVERVNAGVQEYQRAYDNGDVGIKRQSKSGKNLAHGRPRKIFDRKKARHMREIDKMSWREIETALGVSNKIIRRELAKAA